MTGATYMRAYGFDYFSIPAVLNWNMVRDSDFGWYFGLGTEFALSFEDYREYGLVYYDFPLVMQSGIGTRHFDLNIYWKYYLGLDLCIFGLRVAYLF
jgi:hypothetical protein